MLISLNSGCPDPVSAHHRPLAPEDSSWQPSEYSLVASWREEANCYSVGNREMNSVQLATF